MVDVSAKPETERTARAVGEVELSRKAIDLISLNKVPKGEVFNTARLAGIQAAKRTSDWVPLCHPVRLTQVDIELTLAPKEGLIRVVSTVKALDRTGVEMEALTAVAAACLTVYDMCKAVDKRILIGNIHLLSKKGGRSGEFTW
jgi:cyclic pyranopterin phosphate synthase